MVRQLTDNDRGRRHQNKVQLMFYNNTYVCGNNGAKVECGGTARSTLVAHQHMRCSRSTHIHQGPNSPTVPMQLLWITTGRQLVLFAPVALWCA